MDASKILLQVLCDRPVAYHPDLGRALGSVTAGLFLSQMLYWQGKGSDPEWIWKTQEEMERETALTRREQDTCRRILKDLGIMEEKRAGVPARMYYRLNSDRLIKLLGELYSGPIFRASGPVAPKRQSRVAQSAKLVAPKRQSRVAQSAKLVAPKRQSEKAQSAKQDAPKRQTRLAQSANPFITEITQETTQGLRKPEISHLRSVLSDLPERTIRALFDALHGEAQLGPTDHKLARAYDIYLRREGILKQTIPKNVKVAVL